MAAHCLDRLENLREQGVNEEVIRNTAGLVYLGGSGFSSASLNPLTSSQMFRDGRYCLCPRALLESIADLTNLS